MNSAWPPCSVAQISMIQCIWYYSQGTLKIKHSQTAGEAFMSYGKESIERQKRVFGFLQYLAPWLYVGRNCLENLLNETDRRVKLLCSLTWVCLFSNSSNTRAQTCTQWLRLDNRVGELTSSPALTKAPCLICSALKLRHLKAGMR